MGRVTKVAWFKKRDLQLLGAVLGHGYGVLLRLGKAVELLAIRTRRPTPFGFSFGILSTQTSFNQRKTIGAGFARAKLQRQRDRK